MKTLRATDLSKSYKSRTVVESASLEVNEGEVVGLLGPNGAGKTTCFYMIAGIVPCDRGQITLDDVDITDRPLHERARLGLGYLPQEASIFRGLTVAQNVLAILETRRDLDRSGRAERLDALLGELHIGHLRDQKAQSLSGGERRRLEIARALAAEPRFILLDEPFAGVDPISVIDIQSVVTHLRDRGIGVLITDHSVRETLGICERAYILGRGRIIVAGTPDDVLANDEVREIYLGKDFSM